MRLKSERCQPRHSTSWCNKTDFPSSDAVNFVRNQLREQGEVQSIGDNLNGMLLLANEGFDKENGGLEGTQVNTRMLRWKNRHMNLHRNKRQKAPTKLQSSCKSCDVMCLLSLI
uniref:Uncharacterized protein n=1 Tax=Helianthus annuus TaxID=4232 RepID=A0A251UQA8_HELAN